MKQTAIHIALLVFASALLFFFRLGSVPLMEPDEGRNAEVAREILASGDWITPHLNSVRYLDKPMFFFWAAALSMKLFGVNEFAARLPSALSALIGVIAVYFLGRRMFGGRAGLLSGLILASSPLYLGLGRIVIFDAMLAAFITMSMLAFYLGFTEQEPRRRRLSYLLFWASMALAVLTKGPIGAFFSLSIIGLFLAFTGNLHRIREMELWRGPLLFLAIATPWYVLVSLKNPEYPYYFFITEHLLRYTTVKFHRVKPFWYYVPALVTGFLPWAFFLPSAAVHFLRTKRKEPGSEAASLQVLGIWAAVIFLFFSASRTKMPVYILPLFPAVALLTGKAWDDHLEGRAGRRLFGVPFYILAACVLAVGNALLFSGDVVRLIEKRMADYWTPEAMSFLRSAGAAALVSGAISLFIALKWKNGAVRFGIVAALSFLLFASGLSGLAWESSLRSSKVLAQRVLAERRPGDAVLTYENFPSSFLFYMREQVPVVSDFKGILGSNFILDYDQNYRGAQGPPSIMGRDEFKALLGDRRKRVYILTREDGGGRMQNELHASPERPERILSQGKTALWVRKESP